jgi:anti-anti-sigma regulatory factor
MATNMVSLKIDADKLSSGLTQAADLLGNGDDELVLDFSSVQRIDTVGLKALEQLVAQAEERKTRLVLQGVNVDLYKVLKLYKLAPRVTIVH